MKPIYLTLLILWPSILFSQTQLTHKKKSYVDSLGRYYQQATLPVYLSIATSSDGSTTPLHSSSGREFVLEGHGHHAIKHENLVTMQNDEFNIYADGIAPVTSAVFLNGTAFSSEKKYYGTGLVVRLTGKDEMSGVESTFHSLNGQPFQNYRVETLDHQGEYTYSYYSVDNTGNVEKINKQSFVVDTTPPISFHNIVGISEKSVVSATSTIYLTFSDSLSGVAKSFYKFDKEPFKLYYGNKISFQYLPDGEHVLTYFSVDNVANKEAEKSVKFYLDKTAPILSADILGDKFIVGDKVYFSGRTKLKLTSIDNKSGVKEMVYSINDAPFGKYTEPFYLPGKSGFHTVKFYAIDNTNNTAQDDFNHSVGLVYVDLTGPSLSHHYSGPTFVKGDTVFVNPKTKITLTGHDPEAGLKKITYRLNGSDGEIPYTGPVELNTDGFQMLEYYGYDNVNNKNSKSTLFIVDANGPQIANQFTVAPNKEGKYPSYTSIYLSATDAKVGADQIRYSINGTKEQPYLGQLKGFAKNKDYVIKIRATDLLGNPSMTEVKFKTDTY
jgi:hypothetical protein